MTFPLSADVFISHASADRNTASSLCERLEARGIQCWLAPRDIRPGRHFAEEALAAIEGAHAIVVLLSQQANASVHVRNEVDRAVSYGKPVFPVRIEDILPSGALELYLSSHQWIDAWSSTLDDCASAIHQNIQELSPPANIAIVGIGGGAVRILNGLTRPPLPAVSILAAHTYRPTLERSPLTKKLQLGAKQLQGKNAAGDPQAGRAAAQESEPELQEELLGKNLVLVVTCLGGGTGTGAAPRICELARISGAVTTALVTLPFAVEGTRRRQLAEAGLAELTRSADAVIVVPNDNLPNTDVPLREAFASSDALLQRTLRSICHLITTPGLVNIDFADVAQLLRGSGKGFVGQAAASGQDATRRAAQRAIDMLRRNRVNLRDARKVLWCVTSDETITLTEINDAAEEIQSHINADAIVVFGNVREPLKDETWRAVSILALDIA